MSKMLWKENTSVSVYKKPGPNWGKLLRKLGIKKFLASGKM